MLDAEIIRAVDLLEDGQLVVLPTDTIYGVAADFRNDQAVAKIYELKGRSNDKPLAVLISSMDMLDQLTTEITEKQRLLMRRLWPGALTLIFKKSVLVADIITGGRSTIGIRMPDHPGTLQIIERLGRPVVATSVNVSGQSSLNTAEDIHREFPQLEVIWDLKGPAGGVESTVLDLSDANLPKLLREGAISKLQIEEILGESLV